MKSALRTMVFALMMSALGIFFEQPVAASIDRLYFECPCSVGREGTTLTVAFGLRNVDSTDSGPLQVSVVAVTKESRIFQTLTEFDATASLSANSSLATSSYDIQLDFASFRSELLTNPARLQLQLIEKDGESRRFVDGILMEFPVVLGDPFSVGEQDYLKDSDGDGVGDINERAEGTDPGDPDSTPGESTIDVLAWYSQGYPRLFDGDPTTRIQHLFDLANVILQDSGLPFQLRLVGLVETHLSDETDIGSVIDKADLRREGDRHVADVAVLFRGNMPGDRCGNAPLGGWLQRGHIDREVFLDRYAVVYGLCGSRTLAHELGHLFGLGHARWQVNNAPTGTWRWSRGHAVVGGFHTVMSYVVEAAQALLVFSDPDARCQGALDSPQPCGVDPSEVDGADAVTSLDAVRFQAARVRDGFEDRDDDGFVDPVDEFPDDPAEWRDTDQDGIGNRADTDDDNDGVSDASDAFPFNASESVDTDADGVGNNADADDDNDGLADGIDLLPLDASEADETVLLFPPFSDVNRQGFLRVINQTAESGEVRVGVGDSTGRHYGPLTLSIDASQTVHFNSEDLESGNAEKGLSDGVGAGEGDWRLELASDLDIDVSSYMRTMDGFLTAMHDVVPSEGNTHHVATFNPASNRNQVSKLLILNRSDEQAEVFISGVDDQGNSPGSAVKATIPPGTTRTITSEQLESGSTGLEGSLGDGQGKWRLSVESDRAITMMNLLESPTGHLTNLSTVPRKGFAEYFVPFVPTAAASDLQGFVRVTNYSILDAEVLIAAYDGEGRRYGPVALLVGANETAHFNSNDLEWGNAEKGLPVGVGSGEGDWRLELTSNGRIEVLSYIRTADGFLTAMHDLVPGYGYDHRVGIFNPGQNRNQVSHLRLVNWGDQAANVTIRGVDDSGQPSLDSVQTSIPARASRTFSATDLESGGPGLTGALGTGTGKWQLNLHSDVRIGAMSLLRNPTGHLTNLSTVPGLASTPPPVEPITDYVSIPLMQEIPPGRFDMGCLSNDHDCNHTELPVREVTIPRAFELSKYEVTVAQWSACVDAGGCPTNRDGLWRSGSEMPVSNVNWDDAQAYVEWLSHVTGDAYRLPTEAEWEYAARAGSDTKFSWGNEAGEGRSNCDGCWNDWNLSRAPVGTFAANAWGLHDMHGNVAEVVEDCWNETYEGAPSDGSAWNTGDCSRRVIRGGDYARKPNRIRSAHRENQVLGTDQRYANHGFRVARSFE